MSLTEHQQGIFDRLTTDIQKGIDGNKDFSMLSLSGSAGTGKTFMLAEIIKKFHGDYNMCLTAPTHKAVKVIRDTLHDNDAPHIDTRTIHSFLSLKLQPDYNTGKPELKPTGKPVNRVHILFCDESSMVSNELLGYCDDRISEGTVKVVVLVGDTFQLKPVDDDTVSEHISNDHDYMLTEIVRQAEDNPIIATASRIKKHIKDKDYPPLHTLFDDLTVVKNRRELVDRYLSDTDDRILGTYTNIKVQNYNDYFRSVIMCNPDASVVPGEMFVFHDTLFAGNDLIHLNADISEVVSCTKEKHARHNIYYWNVRDTDNESYRVIDAGSKEKFDETLEKMIKKAKAEKDTARRRVLWKSYYSTKDVYANVRYNYASTLHRLQGSTVDNVYLDLSDLSNPNNPYYDKDTIFRLIYVGITRARNNVYIIL